MKKNKYTFLLGSLVIITFSIIIARDFRVSEIPNGNKFACANCHINPGGGGQRNAFGTAIENEFLSAPGAAGHVQWSSALATIDSDGDGFTNGEELQDPSGIWTSGAIGNSSLVTNPGDKNSHPAITSIERIDDETIPNKFVLEQNYPNPFNPSTIISFSISKQEQVSLTVYNSLGQFVEELISDELSAGTYNIKWRAVNLSSGVYYYTLSASNFRESKKMILVK